VVAGAILLTWSLVASLIVRRDPGANALDRWGFTIFHSTGHSTWMVRVTELGSLSALVAGSALAALVAVGRDRPRAAVCLVGPAIATLLVEWVVKPAVGRHYAGVLTFPSGHVTAIASVSTAWTLAVPRWLRWPVAAVALVAVLLMIVAVVGLRWHYATDALAGAVFGVGTVLFLDGALHLATNSIGRPLSHRPPG
jgi:membrane-associated phospholipid phosphatase